jgi:L-fucose isomerase
MDKGKRKEGPDLNTTFKRTDEQKEKDWEFVVKMTIIIRDLMVGNSRLAGDFGEEAMGHNAIAAASRGNVNGRIFIPTAIFPNPYLILPLTGTAFARRLYWQRKMTA